MGHLLGMERGGHGVVSELQTLPAGATTTPLAPKGLEGKGVELGIQGPAEPLMLSTCRVSASDADKKALKTQALGLSLNYSFVTPLTSMVVTKPEGQEQSQVAEKPMENGGCENGLLASVATEF